MVSFPKRDAQSRIVAKDQQFVVEEQIEYGVNELCEEDKWLMEVNLRDLNEVAGDREAYWLLAMDMAWERFQIRQREQTEEN